MPSSRMCTWLSIIPGKTVFPDKSTFFVFFKPELSFPESIRVILLPVTTKEFARGLSGFIVMILALKKCIGWGEGVSLFEQELINNTKVKETILRQYNLMLFIYFVNF